MDMANDQDDIFTVKILVSALASQVFAENLDITVISALKRWAKADAVAIAKALGSSKLVRQLNLPCPERVGEERLTVNLVQNTVAYNDLVIGRTQILYKPLLPGELQARLAIESAIDRFLEYLQKVYQIAVLDESDRHVRVFIPSTVETVEFSQLWKEFLESVAFSDYGKYQLPGLVQTFIVMLNTVTLAGRGFSTLDVPILTQAQANVLAAWYRAVIRDVKKRQSDRQRQIDQLKRTLLEPNLPEKERKSKQKELQDKEVMQAKESQKYRENFQKSFVKKLQEQEALWQEMELIQQQIDAGLAKAQAKKLQKQQEKLLDKVFLNQNSIQQKLQLIQQTGNDPFAFIEQDEKQHSEKFRQIVSIVPIFTKIATDQINSTRGDIFTQCVSEMYRLLEMESKDLEPLPPPLLTEEPILLGVRSPGDDSKEFCYSCGVTLDPKNARWQVLRFMFERPSQRRQSSSSEGRPHICSSCAALAFASPLKVTDESIILKLESKHKDAASKLKIKDYLRMLTNKEMNLSAGRYVVLASDRTSSGDLASQKLGQVQYALAKIASIFPVEVLSDFKFSLVIQGNSVSLESRHLIFVKGLMECYRQTIASKEINMTLGDAIRYVQQDLPFLADYTLAKVSGFSTDLKLEQIRERYWNMLCNDLGDAMNSDNPIPKIPKRAKLYQHVAALTGITYAFALALEKTAKSSKKPEDAEREVSKLIEKVDDPIAFCYYATLGDEKKTSVQARLYHNPDSDFIYRQTAWLLAEVGITDREQKDDQGRHYLQLYADDVSRAYQHFAALKDYAQEKDWKELTYNLKLSLYTRFPELVRKL